MTIIIYIPRSQSYFCIISYSENILEDYIESTSYDNWVLFAGAAHDNLVQSGLPFISFDSGIPI